MQKRTMSGIYVVLRDVLVPDGMNEREDIVFRYNGVS